MKFKKKFWFILILLIAVIFISDMFNGKSNRYRGFLQKYYSQDSATVKLKELKRARSKALLRGMLYEPYELKADSIVAFAKQYLNKPYLAAGRDSCGFDCSGFVYFVFKRFGIDVPHSSRLLDTVGTFVPLKEVRKGDILIFTGMNSSLRSPGHVGIVITDNGGPVRFIHSSSFDGVKISQVDSTRYELRYLSARRVLK